MRRLAIILSALGFLWASAITVFILTGGGDGRIRTAFTLAAGAAKAGGASVSLMSANGVWLVGLLLGVTVLAGVPLGVALSCPDGQRATTWTVGLLLLCFSIVAGLTMGLFYLPSAVALLAAATVSGLLGHISSSHVSGRAG